MKRPLPSFARISLTVLALIGIHCAQGQAQAAAAPAKALSSLGKNPQLRDRPDTLRVTSRTAPTVRALTQAQAATATASLNCLVYCGTPVTYNSWSGTAYTLQQYIGRNVRVLVPPHWFDDPTFNEDTRRQFIDAFDVIFEYLTDLVGNVPAGTELLTAAFVPTTGCKSLGCGYVGLRGVELEDAPDNTNNEFYWVTSKTGFQTYAIVHEMTHNFDVYGNEFEFTALPDNSHYWTYIMRSIYSFTRTRASATPPEEYNVSYEQALFQYVQTSGVSWQSCVINQQCASTINGYFAPIGVFYRLVRLYGRDVETRYTAFQSARVAALPNPTDQDRLDSFFEAYSAAANRNMSCLWDMLNWPVSPTARSWADTQFPGANPDCTTIGPGGNPVIVDIQRDFMSPVTSSYDQPQEPAAGFSQNIWTPTIVSVPAYISAQATAATKQYYRLTGSDGNQRIRLNFCAPVNGFSGSTVLWSPNSVGLGGLDGPQIGPGVCTTTQWQNANYVEVEQDAGGTGAYSIQAEVDPYGPWPLSNLWANLSVTRNADGSFNLALAQIDATQVLPTATQVKFWVQNYGWVTSMPWPGTPVPTTLTAKWTPPPGETGDGLVFRAQVLGAAGEGYASDQANPVIYYITPRKTLYVALSPARLLDTRVGTGYTTIDGTAQGTGPITALGTYTLPVGGRAGVPAGTVAVALNVTPVNPASSGYFTLWSGVGAAPNASNLNLNPGYTIPNLVISTIDSNGNVAIFNGSNAAQDVVVDVQGYFPAGGSYVPMTPQRYLDTRSGYTTVDGRDQGAGALSGGGLLILNIAGRTSIPVNGVDAVIFNLTAVQPGTGYITAWPSGLAQPNASNLNLNPGLTIPNLVISGLGSGNVSLFNGGANATDLIADVQGWFPANSGYAALAPARLLDTRSGQNTTDGQYAGIGALAVDGGLDLQVTGRGGVPTDSGVGTVVLNVTAVQPAAGGYITVWPTGSTQPLASNVNLNPGSTIPNLVIAKIGSSGKVSIFNGSQQSTDIIVDVQGWLPIGQ